MSLSKVYKMDGGGIKKKKELQTFKKFHYDLKIWEFRLLTNKKSAWSKICTHVIFRSKIHKMDEGAIKKKKVSNIWETSLLFKKLENSDY